MASLINPKVALRHTNHCDMVVKNYFYQRQIMKSPGGWIDMDVRTV